MASLAEIQALVEQIKADLPLLVQRSQIAPKQVVIVNGLSDMSERLGLVQAGEFRSGNGREPGFGFSGVRMGYPAFAYAGDTWNFVGINADVLQVGISSDDGKMYFGAGSGVVNSAGIEIVATGVLINSNGYKFVTAPDGPILGGLYNFHSGGTSYVELRSHPEAGSGISNTIASIESVAGGTAWARMTADSGGYAGNASMLYIVQTATERSVFIQDVLEVDFSSADYLNFQAVQTDLGNTQVNGNLIVAAGSDIYIDDDMPLYGGWFPRTDVVTRLGTHQFRVPGDQTLIYRKGAKFACTDSAVNKFGVILSNSYDGVNTTVNLIPNSSYSLVGTVADPQISYAESPMGFPDFFNFAPTYAGSTGGTPTVTNLGSSWRPIGNSQLKLDVHYSITAVGTATGSMRVYIPITASVTSMGTGRENAVTGSQIQVLSASTSNWLTYLTYNNGVVMTAGWQILSSIVVDY
jgi:hypothetical protein